MAEAANNSINFMALMNPNFAAQQQKFQIQQLLAQKMMEDGNQPDDPAKLANPGGFVVPQSPLLGASKAIEKGLGGYMSRKAMEGQLDAYKQLGASMRPQANGQALGNAMSGGTTPDITSNPNWQLAGMLDPSTAAKALMAGPIKTSETAATPFVTPQGTYQMGSQIMGGNPAASNSAPKSPTGTMPPAEQNAAINDLYGDNSPPDASATPKSGGIGAPGGEVNLQMPADKSAAPMALDGKPLLPDLKNIPVPDPTGTPKFKTENTKTGVEQTIQDQKDSAEGNKAFAATAQSLGQEKARLDNLIQVYKDVQSGTLTAQNPELFNRLAALGFHDSPEQIKDLAGIQNATQNHILQVIQQIKDTNANAGGGAPTRVFGSEISQLLENGESTKGQPEALWNVIGQAKGVVDHHLDMVNGWQKSGGLGNRLAGGYTMRPDDFATQFSTSHNITDYRDKALKDMGPFKGMAGNNGITVALPTGVTHDDIKAEMARRTGKK